MTQAIRLRRAFVATLILTAILTAIPIAQGNASPVSGSLSKTAKSTLCRIDWREGRPYVKHLIRCAATHLGVNVDRALSIADRESRFDPGAYNSWSCAKGIYQHLCAYWPDRATKYGFDDWSAYNARANIIVTMRMVKHIGWQPWGG
jgi:soluble lytic murein transglycosylase-like protein